MWGNWVNPKSWAALATLPFRSRGGFSRRPKRCVGHIELGFNSRAYPGPSRTCAPFAPIMSVRIFGHFLPFSIFLARHALCSAPPCTPDAWTNEPHMVCSLCTLVPLTHTPRGGTEAHTHKELCYGVCGYFCHFGTCRYNSSFHHGMAHGDHWDQSTYGPTLDSHWISHRTLSPVSKPSWRNTLGDTVDFGSFLGMPKHPFRGPQFQPPMWSIGGPISFCP